MLLIVGALWAQSENGLEDSSQPAFPTTTAVRVGKMITQTLHAVGRREAVSVKERAKLVKQESVTWTMHQYAVHLPTSHSLSSLVHEISELLYTSGGEILQTYYQPEMRKATVVIGVETFITHSIVFTWDAPVATKTPSAPEQPATPSATLKAAIVIDDLGASKQAVARLLAMEEDFTFSILPHLHYSTDIAAMLHELGKETLLHLPMQPQGYPLKSPGKGAIMVNTAHRDIERIIHDDLATVPHVRGVNNHMGSLVTMDSQQMQSILQVLQRAGLFFLDSRTTAKTIAYQTAQELGVLSARREVFLDVFPEVEFVKTQLEELLTLAESGQPAIAIGHPKEATFQGLAEMLPEFQRRGVKIVRVSQFMH